MVICLEEIRVFAHLGAAGLGLLLSLRILELSLGMPLLFLKAGLWLAE